MALQFNTLDTKKTAQFLSSRARKQLDSFYQKPYAVISAELLATITAVVFLAIFAIRPTLTTMSTLLKDLEDRTETQDQLKKKVAALSTLSSELPAVETQIAQLNAGIPDSAEFDNVLLRLEFLASKNNVIIDGLRTNSLPKEATTESVATEVVSFPITISISGRYENVTAYLSDLISMDRVVTADTIVFQSELDPTTGFPSQTITLSTTLNVYYRGIGPTESSKQEKAPDPSI